MPRAGKLQSMVSSFASELERAVREEATNEFRRRFDELRASILSGAKTAPALGGRRAAAGKVARQKADLKPCPICGERNKARRFSYLCDKHRTKENRAKFKGASRAKKAARKAG